MENNSITKREIKLVMRFAPVPCYSCYSCCSLVCLVFIMRVMKLWTSVQHGNQIDYQIGFFGWMLLSGTILNMFIVLCMKSSKCSKCLILFDIVWMLLARDLALNVVGLWVSDLILYLDISFNSSFAVFVE